MALDFLILSQIVSIAACKLRQVATCGHVNCDIQHCDIMHIPPKRIQYASGKRGTPWHTTKRVTVATVVVAWRRMRPVGGACGYASAMHRRKAAGRCYLNELQDA